MRSWRVRGWPLSRPEAGRPPPPSSLPSMAEWPGGTRAFPRWRERSRALVPTKRRHWRNRPRLPSKACKLDSRSRGQAYSAAGQAASALHAMAILQVHQAKALKQVHEGIVPTRGWCRSCARRLTSLYERRKSRRGPSGRRCPPWWSRSAISGSTWQRWRTSTRHAFSTPPSPREGCFGDTVEGFAQQFSAVQQQTEAIQHILPRRDAPSTAAPGPGLGLPVAVGALLRPPELLRPRPNRH